MKKLLSLTLASSLLLIPALHRSQAQVAQSAADRSKALSALFADMWEDRLEHSPEFASSIGDKRWNDQLTDYSVAAYNDRLARGRDYLLRLAAIDTTGLSDQEQLSKDLMARQLAE